MFQSLAEFYNSPEWKDTRRAVIAQRTSKKDGILYCEHSGVPLLKSYDIVVHHVEPLTMANVNDYKVSLNPENLLVVSHKAHNEIHARFGYTASKKVYYVWGPPCSGKTTFVLESKGNSDLVVDMDSIWECIVGERYQKPNALKTNAFMLRDCLMDMVRTRAGKWERAWVIDGGALKGERERRIASLGAEPIFIGATMEECLKRLRMDDSRLKSDLNAWERFIIQWFENYTE